jgi:hypothetical protein
MDTSTGTQNGGEQRFLTIHEFCIWAEITQAETEEEIRSGRLRPQMCEADMVIFLDEAFRWIKAKHGITTPFYWRPLPKGWHKVNPFTDDLMTFPFSLNTVVL